MIESIFIFIGLAWFANLIAWKFGPLQDIKESIHYYLIMPIWFKYFMNLIDCSTCTGFWIGIIYYHDPIISLLLSLFSVILEKIIRE